MKLRELLLWGLALLIGAQSWAIEIEHAGTGNTILDPKVIVIANTPTGFELAPVTDILDTELLKRDLFYTVGGVRLNIKLALDSLTDQQKADSPKLEWSIGSSGLLCSSGSVLPSQASCLVYTANDVISDRSEFWWEPSSWTTSLNAESQLKITFENPDKNPDRIIRFRIATREISKKATIMKGSDIQLLETMLWQLGISPQEGYYRAGREGARISSVRFGTTNTKSCVAGENQSKRKYFLTYSSALDGCVSTELMVKRFNVRNTKERGTILTKHVDAAPGKVTNVTLGWLKRDWGSYMTAFQNFSAEGVISQSHSSFDSWLTDAVKVWEKGIGSYVPKTLTKTKYNEILTKAGLNNGSRTTKNLLKVWIADESKYHWGGNPKNYQQTNFRMTEGADESGSLSFSQLKYQFRYGKKPCSAHDDAGLNLFNPKDNLASFVVHTSSSNASTTDTASCSGGFYLAFDKDTLRLAYNHKATREPLTDLRGIKHANGAITTITDASKEDEYENLAKAIAMYNADGYAKGGVHVPFFTAQSWPRLLRYKKFQADSQANSASVCHGCRYSLKIRNHAHVLAGHLRTYIWKGGTYPTNLTLEDGSPDPNAGTEWCFKYGEEEWMAGKEFKKIKTRATGTAIKAGIGRVNCVTGVLL